MKKIPTRERRKRRGGPGAVWFDALLCRGPPGDRRGWWVNSGRTKERGETLCDSGPPGSGVRQSPEKSSMRSSPISYSSWTKGVRTGGCLGLERNASSQNHIRDHQGGNEWRVKKTRTYYFDLQTEGGSCGGVHIDVP